MGFDKTHKERVHLLVSLYRILFLKTWKLFLFEIKKGIKLQLYKNERCVFPGLCQFLYP